MGSVLQTPRRNQTGEADYDGCIGLEPPNRPSSPRQRSYPSGPNATGRRRPPLTASRALDMRSPLDSTARNGERAKPDSRPLPPVCGMLPPRGGEGPHPGQSEATRGIASPQGHSEPGFEPSPMSRATTARAAAAFGFGGSPPAANVQTCVPGGENRAGFPRTAHPSCGYPGRALCQARLLRMR